MDSAVERALAVGATYVEGPLSASLRLRYLEPRALDTTDAVRSRLVTLLNVGARYAVNRQLTLGLDVFNLAGRKGNHVEYFYASCTTREAAIETCGGGIEGRHIHPMEPRTVRISAR